MNCFVFGCKTNSFNRSSRKKNKLLGLKNPSVFSAPKDPELLEKWRTVIPRQDKVFSATHKLCELHFDERCLIRNFETKLPDGTVFVLEREKTFLKKDAIPSIFSNPSEYFSPNTQQRQASTAPTCLPEKEIKIENVLNEIRPRTYSNTKSQVLEYENLSKEISNYEKPEEERKFEEVLKEISDKNQLSEYEILIKELGNLEKPDPWWTLSHTLNYVVCAKWDADCSCERRVILFKDFSYKIFLRDVQISIEGASTQNIQNLSQLLQTVNRLIICQTVGSEKSDKCIGYVNERGLTKRKFVYCDECKLLYRRKYDCQRKKVGEAARKKKKAQKLQNAVRRNSRLLKRVKDLKDRLRKIRGYVRGGYKANRGITQEELFEIGSNNQDDSGNSTFAHSEDSTDIENSADDHVVVAEFVICNE